MPGGGALHFTTRQTTAPPCVEITVSDTGQGIPADVLPHIFEPFFTTKEMGRGTGLGLATAYATVQQCRGTIRVETESGAGTKFIIRIPQSKKLPAAKPPAPADAPGGNARIMVVEDEESVRELCSSVLESRGYTVVQSAAATDAIAICEQQRHRFDLLLTDVMMPDLSGEELVRRLRTRVPGLKVLFMSGYDRPGANNAPLSPLLLKPFTPTELLSKVKQVLSAAANN
jgi:two-component system, cell cycle sensor histidine kinase and response regulator CckA